MSSRTQIQGQAWERVAESWLATRGLITICRGYRCRSGELDLICRDRETLVIVEVRARRSRSHGGAAASIDKRKRSRIIRATRHFLMHHAELNALPVRFDVFAIDDAASTDPELVWISDAFQAS